MDTTLVAGARKKVLIGVPRWAYAQPEAEAWRIEVAAHLGRRMADPDFPKAHRGPGRAHPRWLAAEVRAWFLHRQDAKAA